MPTTTTTTRQRNDAIREWARANSAHRTQRQTARFVASYCDQASGLSETTICNILRGRDLNPPPSARRRRRSGNPLGVERRFGVEIECNGVDRSVVQRQMGRFPRWTLKRDVSVNGSGLELVSPPLRGEEGLNELREVCTMLQDVGAQVDRSCGLHVHHEARDLGARGIARFAQTWTDNQDMLDWLVSPSRRDGRWCRRLSRSELANMRSAANRGHVRSPGSRYKAVNVAAFGRHGTVEIRQHQGTLNFRKIEAWIRLGQGLMDAALQLTDVEPRGLTSLVNQLVDEDTAAFLVGRALQLGAPVAEVSR